MRELIAELEKWSVKGKLLQPYYVKPLLRSAAEALRKAETDANT